MRQKTKMGSGAAVAGALLATGAEAAQRPASGLGRYVDVHHHFLPPELVEAMKASKVPAGNNNPPQWSRSLSLKRMDENAIATSIMSISEGVEMATPSESARMCRLCNDYGAKLMSDTPARFGLFATLPLPDVNASLKEIEYVYGTLHTDGIVMMSHYADGQYLGDPAFSPVFEELNRRNAVVFVHPKGPFYGARGANNAIKYNGGGIPELPIDTTRAIISLLGEGTADRFPDVRFIFPHAGGAISSLASRVGVLGSRTPGFKLSGYDKVAKALGTFYYDITNSVRPSSMNGIRALAAPTKLLFGTDVPYGDGPRDGRGEFIKEAVSQLPHVGLSGGDLAALSRRNAEALFPRLKQRS